ncbi:MAG: hypothetical protein QOI53_4413 [Verrucomicrobiota bacterium]|jgi:hypothetical protein|nr:hypothetical protein [Verrucomicrobiota bacterium]
MIEIIGGPGRDRTDDLFHAISAPSRNSLKLHGMDRALRHASHGTFRLLDLYRTSAIIRDSVPWRSPFDRIRTANLLRVKSGRPLNH